MGKYLILGHRQSGKSELAIYEFMKDYMNSILLASNLQNAKAVIDRIEKRYKLSSEQLSDVKQRVLSVASNSAAGVPNFNTIIFDEYFYMPEKERNDKMTMFFATDIYVFSTKPPKGDKRRKAAKEEIKNLIAHGFAIVPKIKSLNPEAHRKNKRAEKEQKLRKQAEKLGLVVVSIAQTVSSSNPIVNWNSNTTVTRVDPNTPSTFTADNDDLDCMPRRGTASRAVQGKFDWPGDHKQKSLFD